MYADPIIYCLQSLTDYRQFERLCSDIMAGVGYTSIDPLGGSNDRGRDAIYVSRQSPDKTVIFAYSVRSDWRRKLRQDCQRIQDEEHQPDELVFVCNSTLTAAEKDEARDSVHSQFGWKLDLFDAERLRVLLTSNLRHLVASHPSIFCPPWFPARGGLTLAR